MRKILASLYYACIVAVTFFALPSLANTQEPIDTELEQLMQTYSDDGRYDCVCWLTSHNSFAYRDEAFLRTVYISPNQHLIRINI